MQQRRIDFSKCTIYTLLALASLFLYFIGDNGEPLPLALAYATASVGIPPTVSVIIGFFPALFSGNVLSVLLALAQSILLWFGFFLQERLRRADFKKSPVFPLLFLVLGFGLFVAFSPFQLYVTPFSFTQNTDALTQKTVIAAVLFLIASIFSVALKALFRKVLKYRLRGDELVFLLFFFVMIGIGLCRFLGVNAYMGTALFVLLLFSAVTKDASVMLCAFTLALPPLFTAGESFAKFFLLGAAISLFAKSGRLATACAALLVFFGYGYFEGLYAYPTHLLVQSVLSAVLPALIFVLIPSAIVRELENKLIFYREKHLTRIAINRNRAAIGEKLFEISAVFREIQSTFIALGNHDADASAKGYMRNSVVESVCRRCQNYAVCQAKNAEQYIDRLIEVGCLKGKTSLIDIPRALGELCVNQSGILYALNRQITEYKRYRLEAENAAAGRNLLATQALGVSEILKNLALEQSEPLRLYTERERALSNAMLNVGIICSEILIYGEEDNPTLSLITFGKADVITIANVASHVFQTDMIISERIALANEKFCCILRKKPNFDAAFGVASRKKSGETVCGDTHSVIKIDEKKFMVALSDGMGSGEYARRVSESTISLLESFYRAKMPSSLVLNAVNRLLTFNKEERFACVDIAIVDLGDGIADVIKIGSPLGFILSGNTVKVLETRSLPMGILDALHPDTARYPLQENDVLLFLSDGITDAFGSASDLYEVLRSLPTNNPQELADCLLESALRAYGGKAKDDMTALAVRLFKPRAA
ncbi:MAG: hypothetical protein E7352_03385 [Clostridiales bacterium]|nr:hypothetical protein [Clostridiales bacterium]